MRLRILLVWLVLLLGVAPVVAEEPSKEEKKFLKSMTAALSSKAVRVQVAAQKALLSMGSRTAHYLVREIGRLKDPARKRAIEILIELGKDTLEAIEELKRPPVGPRKKALDEVTEVLVGKGGVGGFGEPDEEVQAAVERIMKRVPLDSWSSNAKETDELAALGRDAIPVLLTYLDPDSEMSRDSSMLSRWALGALERMVTPKDIPRLGALLDKGWDLAAHLLKTINRPAAVPFLVKALQRGQLTLEIGEACKHYGDERFRKPACALIAKLDDATPHGLGDLLEMLVKMRAREVLPALHKLTDAALDPAPGALLDPEAMLRSMNRNRNTMILGRALVGLGSDRGIPLLIGLLDVPESDKWLAGEAGRALNRATGESHWQRGGMRDRAKAAYEKWWVANRGLIEWNEKQRRFVRIGK